LKLVKEKTDQKAYYLCPVGGEKKGLEDRIRDNNKAITLAILTLPENMLDRGEIISRKREPEDAKKKGRK